MTIKKYCNLIGWEPFLARTWEPDFSWLCSFCSMLMNHKNLHFTQIPDKTNDVIFITSPCFWAILTIFGHFCPMGIFSKKSGCVTHNYIWAPNTMQSFRKKQWVNPEKTYWQTEGRTKGQTDRPYFIGPFQPRPGVQ